MSGEHQTTQHQPSGNPLLNLLLLVGVVAAVGVIFSAMLVEAERPTGSGGLPIGAAAPPIAAAGWINGEPPDLAGKVVVVDAWATWCRPCWQVAPELVRLYQEYHPRGVVFIGLSNDGPEALAQVDHYIERNGIEWPNGYGAGATLQEFQLTSIPALWIIDRNGKVVWNRDSQESIETALGTVLAE